MVQSRVLQIMRSRDCPSTKLRDEPGIHTINASLKLLLGGRKISVEDARNATTYRLRLQPDAGSHSRRIARRIKGSRSASTKKPG